jgi:hypothetical protein
MPRQQLRISQESAKETADYMLRSSVGPFNVNILEQERFFQFMINAIHLPPHSGTWLDNHFARTQATPLVSLLPRQ